MLRTFRIGGIHPPENKLSAGKKIEVLATPKQVIIPLGQHIGAPALAVVKKGDMVKVGTLLAKAGGFVSANIHSSVSGKVNNTVTVSETLLAVPRQERDVTLKSLAKHVLHFASRLFFVLDERFLCHHDGVATFHHVATVNNKVYRNTIVQRGLQMVCFNIKHFLWVGLKVTAPLVLQIIGSIFKEHQTVALNLDRHIVTAPNIFSSLQECIFDAMLF